MTFDKKQYDLVHGWLKANYGPANHCDNIHCNYNPTTFKKRYHWAHIHGKDYECKRENFVQLCAKCHSNYDQYTNMKIDFGEKT